MLEGKSVAVVVPAYREEELIGATLGGIPGFVDRVYVVDDGSADGTAERARSFGDSRVEVITHERNEGVGAAILTGYGRALADEVDVVCVMAGDNQMDPAELEQLVRPVAGGEVDYAKANGSSPARRGESSASSLRRQRDSVLADEDCVRLLARRRLAVGVHGDLARDARAARP
jgi:glycosyltransferase involved in cell wall biosynthesis